MSVKILAKHIHQNAVEKGFWEKEHNFGTDLMLIVSELGECIEAHRVGKHAHLENIDTDILLKSKNIFIEQFEKHIKDTVEDEIADAIIRLLDLCEGMEIDIEKHIGLKMLYNSTREKMHGKKY